MNAILFLGDALANKFSIVLFYKNIPIIWMNSLHHTLSSCMAFAQYIDSVTPYVVACVGVK